MGELPAAYCHTVIKIGVSNQSLRRGSGGRSTFGAPVEFFTYTPPPLRRGMRYTHACMHARAHRHTHKHACIVTQTHTHMYTQRNTYF